MKITDEIKLRAAALGRALHQAQHELVLQARETTEELAQLRTQLQATAEALGDGAPRIDAHRIGAELGVEPAGPSDADRRALAAAELAITEATLLAEQIGLLQQARLLLELTNGCDHCRSATTVQVAVPCRRCNRVIAVAVQR